MARFIKDRSKVKGQVPGSLILLGKQKMDKTEIQLIQYDEKSIFERETNSIDEALELVDKNKVNWINIHGIHDVNMVQTIGDKYAIQALILENILNTDQRPKYIDEDNYDAFILKMLHTTPANKEIKAEQITIILDENIVITLQEQKGDVFKHVRERIRTNKGRIRKVGNDYLAYALMDAIVDNYTIIIEEIGRKIEELEDILFQMKDNNIIEDIYRFKIELNFIRKSVRPVKDLMNKLLKSESNNFHIDHEKYLQDLNELVIQSTDTIELYNNLISDQLSIYNSNVGNRMNEVMKVLTIFASIFIPLTFIAGIYGMNFEYMPELHYKFAYPIFWGVVLFIFISLLTYFKKKRWL